MLHFPEIAEHYFFHSRSYDVLRHKIGTYICYMISMSLAYGQCEDVAAVRLCALVLSLVCLFLAVVATLRRIAPRRGTCGTSDLEHLELRGTSVLRKSGNWRVRMS